VNRWLISALTVSAAALLAPLAIVSETRAATDPCKPIGRTEDGKLVYSMKCENLPIPLKPPVAAAPPAAQQPPPPVAAEEEDPGGIFGMHAPSFIRPTNNNTIPGAGSPR
jgi:hypothetical protein